LAARSKSGRANKEAGESSDRKLPSRRKERRETNLAATEGTGERRLGRNKTKQKAARPRGSAKNDGGQKSERKTPRERQKKTKSQRLTLDVGLGHLAQHRSDLLDDGGLVLLELRYLVVKDDGDCFCLRRAFVVSLRGGGGTLRSKDRRASGVYYRGAVVVSKIGRADKNPPQTANYSPLTMSSPALGSAVATAPTAARLGGGAGGEGGGQHWGAGRTKRERRDKRAKKKPTPPLTNVGARLRVQTPSVRARVRSGTAQLGELCGPRAAPRTHRGAPWRKRKRSPSFLMETRRRERVVAALAVFGGVSLLVRGLNKGVARSPALEERRGGAAARNGCWIFRSLRRRQLGRPPPPPPADRRRRRLRRRRRSPPPPRARPKARRRRARRLAQQPQQALDKGPRRRRRRRLLAPAKCPRPLVQPSASRAARALKLAQRAEQAAALLRGRALDLDRFGERVLSPPHGDLAHARLEVRGRGPAALPAAAAAAAVFSWGVVFGAPCNVVARPRPGGGRRRCRRRRRRSPPRRGEKSKQALHLKGTVFARWMDNLSKWFVCDVSAASPPTCTRN